MESLLVFSALLAAVVLLFGLRSIHRAWMQARRTRLLRSRSLRLQRVHAMLDEIEGKMSPR